MNEFIHNFIEAAKTADSRDGFNMYDIIGAVLTALIFISLLIIGGTFDRY